MNYYQHHIGDFIRDTSRLTDSQCMAYLRMMWIYYETESPFENDVDAIAFKIGANASDVHQIIKHFFFENGGFLHNSRCDKEILSFRGKSEKAKKSANARWENANAMRTHTERNANERVFDANQEPVTSNQDIKTIPDGIAKKDGDNLPKAFGVAWLVEKGIDEQDAIDWLKVRKTKRAPLTLSAWKLLETEAAKAGITTAQAVHIAAEKSWQSFVAEYMQNSKPAQGKTNALQFTATDYNRGINADGSF